MHRHEHRQDFSDAPAPAVVAAWVENHRRFLAFLERRVESRAAAEEILPEAFVRGLEQAGEIRDEERVVAWFYRLLRNAVVDHYRRRGAEARGLEALARELGDASEPAPEIEAALCHCFEALLPALRPEYAEILRRVDLEGRRPASSLARRASPPTTPWSGCIGRARHCGPISSAPAGPAPTTAASIAAAV